MAELAQLPGALDLSIYRGDDVNFQVTLTDSVTSDPLVLPTTGWRAQVRVDTDPTSGVLFTITVDGSSAATGVLGLSIAGADTSAIEDSPVAWDLENTTTDRTYLAGKVRLGGQVSRDV
jgi:hypothetical protein